MSITKFTKSHRNVRQTVLDCMEVSRELQLSGETRWGTTILCIRRVLDAKDAHQIIQADKDCLDAFQSDDQIK
jgi:hypothetical protein